MKIAYNTLGIYVDRYVNGSNKPLKLVNQDSYKEWVGCYTRIRFNYSGF